MDCFKMYIFDLGILIQVDENETTEESWGCFHFSQTKYNHALRF